MKRPMLGPIDPFSLSPLLALLPSEGKLDRISSFKESFFARHERVATQRQDAADPDLQRKLLLEEAMLRQVLDWLAVRTTDGGEE